MKHAPSLEGSRIGPVKVRLVVEASFQSRLRYLSHSYIKGITGVFKNKGASSQSRFRYPPHSYLYEAAVADEAKLQS